VSLCHQGMARPRVAEVGGGEASRLDGSYKYIEYAVADR
jgi:hypothetical protein